MCSAKKSPAHRSDAFTIVNPAGLPAGASADAAAAARLGSIGTMRSPIRNAAANIRRLMRPAIDPYIQPGDMARICRPVDWFGLNHYSPVYVKAQATSMLGFDFGEKPAGVPLTPIGWPINPEAFSETLRIVHEELRFADLRS